MCPETQLTPWEVREGVSEKGAFALRPEGWAGLTGEGGSWLPGVISGGEPAQRPETERYPSAAGA